MTQHRTVCKRQSVGLLVVLLLAGSPLRLSADTGRGHSIPGSVSVTASSQTAGDKQLAVGVFPGGGQVGSSGSFVLSGNTGQTAVGQGHSQTMILLQGFWPAAAGKFGCCFGITGNVEGDPADLTDCSDLQALVDYIVFNSGILQGCSEENDVTADGTIDGSDLQQLVDYVFFDFPPVQCPN